MNNETAVQSPDQLRWDAIIKWAHASAPDAVVAIRDLAKEVVDAREERDRLTQQRDQFLEERKAVTEDYAAERATNAELLRLLERHHAATIAMDDLLRDDEIKEYVGSELYLKTIAAIERAKEKV